MSTTTLRLPTVVPYQTQHQPRPQRIPPSLPSTSSSSSSSDPAVRSFPTRDASLRRQVDDNTKKATIDPHLEAALENRRRNGLPVGSRGAWINSTVATGQSPTSAIAHERDQEVLASEQFADSEQHGESGDWNKTGERSTTAQRESLVPLSQSATVSRMTSTRRYMDQLDEDDIEAMEDEEEELENENGNDRATWHSGWGSEARDSVASLGVRTKKLDGKMKAGRESAMSTKTFDSQSADAFHYSMYETMHSPIEPSYSSNLPHQISTSDHSPQPPLSPSLPISPPSSTPSPSTSAPIVRIGPPSPTTDSFLNNPQASTVWQDLPSSPPASPVSQGRHPIHPSSPVSPATSNRAKSQTASKNFSRPFVSVASAPLPPTPKPVSNTPPPPIITASQQQRRPVAPREDSLESISSPNPLDRKSSLGATSSSMGHSGSSTGHSMSSSWEDRKLQALRQHEEAKRAINLAREKSKRNRLEQDYRDDGVEELKTMDQTAHTDFDAYGGEEEEGEGSESSIHFPQLAQDSQAQPPESPYLAYAAPSPPSQSHESTFQTQSIFSEALPRSPPPHILSHPAAAFSSEPRPAPAPPTDFQPSISFPLPMPGSPPLPRRPSLTSFYSSSSTTPRFIPATLNLSASAPPSSTPSYSTSPPTKQRNVLRKPRPRRREEDELSTGLSAPMSRAGSALSSHSQRSTSAISDGESTGKSGPWARFRSRSKSRTRDREAGVRKSTFFDDPPPPPTPDSPQELYVPSTSNPTLRHFASSASLQPPRSQPLIDSLPSPSFPSPSSTSPLSQADFARLQASRPAFLRSKTSFGNGNANPVLQRQQQSKDQEWVLKNVTGPKTVVTGLVHSGESASVYGEGEGGDEMERLNEGIERVGLGHPSSSRIVSGGGGGGGVTMMNRSVSDQGPSTRSYQLQQHDRSASSGQNSLYSNYSIYSLPPPPLNSSPTTPFNPNNLETNEGQNQSRSVRNSTIQKAKETLGGGPAVRAKMMRTPSGNERKVLDPVTPEDFLQSLPPSSRYNTTEVGIDHHEAGDLERAAWCFEQSAKKDGGCGAGMLMYGLTLRHGWGCQLNAPLGFRYLQMAAESVVEDLDRVVFGGRTLTESETNTKAAKSELVLALHEIGVSYRFGWGIEKNKKMAVSYFTLSADLGDQDAQLDVAFAYANGKGCKKDLKKAAHYYRLAIAQGAEDWGLSWIYKPKYMDT
ncbi:hypothetical protein JCM5350_002002 [Sporobolomyces pararoseus]